jgi:hypothetical protein
MIFLTENIPYTPKMLADELDFEENTVKLALTVLEQLDMVVMNQGYFAIAGWNEHQNVEGLDKIREQNRIRQANFKAKQKLLQGNVTNNVTLTLGNATEIEEEKEIDTELDNKNSAKQPSKADVNAFFESVWELYPVKKGKASVSDTKRKVLFKIGYDQMERAINRYLTELKKDASWRKPQNGSTFFNSGYVDYLDENYAPDQTVMGGRTEKLPEWFGRRELDEDEKAAIQRMMSKDDQEEAEQLRRELQESFGRREVGW